MKARIQRNASRESRRREVAKFEIGDHVALQEDLAIWTSSAFPDNVYFNFLGRSRPERHHHHSESLLQKGARLEINDVSMPYEDAEGVLADIRYSATVLPKPRAVSKAMVIHGIPERLLSRACYLHDDCKECEPLAETCVARERRNLTQLPPWASAVARVFSDHLHTIAFRSKSFVESFEVFKGNYQGYNLVAIVSDKPPSTLRASSFEVFLRPPRVEDSYSGIITVRRRAQNLTPSLVYEFYDATLADLAKWLHKRPWQRH